MIPTFSSSARSVTSARSASSCSLRMTTSPWIKGLGDDPDLFLVGAKRNERAFGVELLLEDDDLALDLVAGGLDDVEALVEDELLAGLEHLGLERGVEVDLHLAALREDRDGHVLVGGEIRPVSRRMSALSVRL